MRLGKLYLVVGFAAGLATFVHVVFTWSEAPPTANPVRPGPASDLASESSSLLQAGKQEIAPTQQQPTNLSSSLHASPATPPTVVAQPVLSVLPLRVRDPLTLSLSFSIEAKDPSWSAATEARILSEISQLAGLSLISIAVECRATLCQVQATLPKIDARAVRSLLNVGPTLGLESRPAPPIVNGPGSVIFVAYFAR